MMVQALAEGYMAKGHRLRCRQGIMPLQSLRTRDAADTFARIFPSGKA